MQIAHTRPVLHPLLAIQINLSLTPPLPTSILMVCRHTSQSRSCLPSHGSLAKSRASERSPDTLAKSPREWCFFVYFLSDRRTLQWLWFRSVRDHPALPSPIQRLNLIHTRFNDIGSAEKCIEGLRKYRNLHPSFSKVPAIFQW